MSLFLSTSTLLPRILPRATRNAGTKQKRLALRAALASDILADLIFFRQTVKLFQVRYFRKKGICLCDGTQEGQ